MAHILNTTPDLLRVRRMGSKRLPMDTMRGYQGYHQSFVRNDPMAHTGISIRMG
jgi:hypothetical protein